VRSCIVRIRSSVAAAPRYRFGPAFSRLRKSTRRSGTAACLGPRRGRRRVKSGVGLAERADDAVTDRVRRQLATFVPPTPPPPAASRRPRASHIASASHRRAMTGCVGRQERGRRRGHTCRSSQACKIVMARTTRQRLAARARSGTSVSGVLDRWPFRRNGPARRRPERRHPSSTCQGGRRSDGRAIAVRGRRQKRT